MGRRVHLLLVFVALSVPMVACRERSPRRMQDCSMVTTVHDRMPVILLPDDYDAWLNPATQVAELKELLRPYPADGMECVPV
jgi:hypothetical protein